MFQGVTDVMPSKTGMLKRLVALCQSLTGQRTILAESARKKTQMVEEQVKKIAERRSNICQNRF